MLMGIHRPHPEEVVTNLEIASVDNFQGRETWTEQKKPRARAPTNRKHSMGLP